MKTWRILLICTAIWGGTAIAPSYAAQTAPAKIMATDQNTAAARAGIDKTLAEVNRLLARGTDASEIADVLYDADLQIAIEGEEPFWSNLASFLPKLEEYVQAPCVLHAIDPIRATDTLAVAFIAETCPAAGDAPAENYRMLYVFRKTSRGWRVTMESATAGKF